ncbi:hypothetical protein LDL08_43155 [Nonomuraea glycinis]|uniref:Uncharacterized protein n=1 Tax=Nonomuraea glycinis TaxID=2047744 RepID=A0A918EB55_9ACTN|nr:hypothetical protein [Nonomuraea glycinis]MCA2182977.1 hypothetical protein [Nonomuraea glycinis]GGP17505.1 hypothetical protein GCM10012278_86280 [Nonomuraea glycinis]
MELGDGGHALRVGTTIDKAALSNERRARLHVDLARAHAQRRQIDEAVTALLEAEAITPEQLHNHRVVHQLVSDLLTMRDPASPDLPGLAERVGA